MKLYWKPIAIYVKDGTMTKEKDNKEIYTTINTLLTNMSIQQVDTKQSLRSRWVTSPLRHGLMSRRTSCKWRQRCSKNTKSSFQRPRCWPIKAIRRITWEEVQKLLFLFLNSIGLFKHIDFVSNVNETCEEIKYVQLSNYVSFRFFLLPRRQYGGAWNICSFYFLNDLFRKWLLILSGFFSFLNTITHFYLFIHNIYNCLSIFYLVQSYTNVEDTHNIKSVTYCHILPPQYLVAMGNMISRCYI